MPTIDFSALTGNGRVHNLSGKAKGRDARAALRVDVLDTLAEAVEVILPDDLYAVSPSFFLGLFSQSLTKLGTKEAFLKHYHFRADQVLMQQVYEGIQLHFTRPTALG
jgi:hypothetical protein